MFSQRNLKRQGVLTLLCYLASVSSPSTQFIFVQADDVSTNLELKSTLDCDDSFPIVPADILSTLPPLPPPREDANADTEGADAATDADSNINNNGHRRHLVSLPHDPKSYAPLCTTSTSTSSQELGVQDQPIATVRMNLRHLVTCNAGSCWSNYYQQCTFECTWNDPTPPTTTPTPKPTIRYEETTHPVRLMFHNVPDNYFITKEVKSTILRYVTEIYKSNLNSESGESGLELVEVAFASQADLFNGGARHRNLRDNDDIRDRYLLRGSSSNNDNYEHRQLSYTLYIPLRVTVRGPVDVSDFALSYIMQILRDNLVKLGNYLRSMEGEDYENFRFVSLKAESFVSSDWKVMLESENRTPMPTMRPTELINEEGEEVLEEDVGIQSSVMEEGGDGNSSGSKWWIWLIVAFILIAACLCVVMVCMRRYRDEEDAKNFKSATTTSYNNFSNNYFSQDANAIKKKSQPQSSQVTKSGKSGKSRSGYSTTSSYYHHSHKSNNRSSDFTINGSIATEDSRYTKATNRSSHRRRPLKLVRKFSSLSEGDIESEESDFEEESRMPKRRNSDPSTRALPITADADSAVPVGMDPPEEMAIVMYNPTNGNTTSDGRLKREPTQYNNHDHSGHRNHSSQHHHHNHTLVIYSPENDGQDQEPSGKKVPKKSSMFAEDVYFNTNAHAVEPGGKKVPKNQSMYVDGDELLDESCRMSRSGSGGSNISTDPPSHEQHVHHNNNKPTSSSNKKKKEHKSSKRSSKDGGKQKSSSSKKKSGTIANRVERMKRTLSWNSHTNNNSKKYESNEESSYMDDNGDDEDQSYFNHDEIDYNHDPYHHHHHHHPDKNDHRHTEELDEERSSNYSIEGDRTFATQDPGESSDNHTYATQPPPPSFNTAAVNNTKNYKNEEDLMSHARARHQQNQQLHHQQQQQQQQSQSHQSESRYNNKIPSSSRKQSRFGSFTRLSSWRGGVGEEHHYEEEESYSEA